MYKSNLHITIVNGEEYARAVDIAKDKGFKSGKILCDQYRDKVMKIYNQNFLPCKLFYEETKLTLIFKDVRAISANDMNIRKIKHKYEYNAKTKRQEVVPYIDERNSYKYNNFKRMIKMKANSQVSLNDIVKITSKTLKVTIVAYMCPNKYNGKQVVMDTDNIEKPTIDAVFNAIRDIVGLEHFDDNIITNKNSRIKIVNSSKEEGIVFIIENDNEASDEDIKLRCRNIWKEIEDKKNSTNVLRL